MFSKLLNVMLNSILSLIFEVWYSFILKSPEEHLRVLGNADKQLPFKIFDVQTLINRFSKIHIS